MVLIRLDEGDSSGQTEGVLPSKSAARCCERRDFRRRDAVDFNSSHTIPMPPAPPPARDADGAMNMLLHAARLRVRRSAAVGLIATVAVASAGMIRILAVTL